MAMEATGRAMPWQKGNFMPCNAVQDVVSASTCKAASRLAGSECAQLPEQPLLADSDQSSRPPTQLSPLLSIPEGEAVHLALPARKTLALV